MLTDHDPEQIVNTKWVASRVGVAENTVAWWRWTDQGPRYFKAGARAVRYRRGDVEEWLAEQQRTTGTAAR